MPKYKVLLQQYVQQLAVTVIEAGTPEEAAAKAQRLAREGELDLDWSDCNDSDVIEADEVYTMDGEHVLTCISERIFVSPPRADNPDP